MIGREFAHYRITKPLGRGGMGEVYLAEDTSLGRKVAIKFLPDALGEDAGRVRRFEQEALAASALNHPNILTVHAFGADHGRQFLVTEFVDGKTLRTALRDQTLSLDDALRIAEQIGLALSAAHEAGIVHRDIKPENIMLREDGIVKVLDFGLAKFTGPAPGGEAGAAMPLAGCEIETRTLATIPGCVLGTVAYMSPEQVRGLEVDERTDVWSLGVVLYEMLAGAPPFAGATASDIIASILRSEPAPLASRAGAVPPELERLVERALCKSREERYRNIKDLLADLRVSQRVMHEPRDPSCGSGAALAQSTPSTPALPAAPGVAAPLPPGRRKRWVLAAAGAMAALLAAFGVYSYGRRAGRAPVPALLRPAKGPMARMRLSTVGRVQEATVSSDGGLVAYVSVEGIRPTVYVQPATGGNATAVVPPSDATYHGLVFTPDSRRVFFRRGERTSSINELYEVPAAGGRASKVITDVDSMISFAPDGNRFVFRRDSPEAHESYLLVAAADGSGERKIATRQIAEAFVSDPVWSPDGRTVATFAINPTADEEQRYSIVVINLPDAAVKVLGRTRWRWTRHLRWLPDGRELLATAHERASDPFQIWRVGYPGGEVLNVTNDSSDYDYVSVTADASALLTVQTDAAEALFVAPAADLTSPRRLTPDAAVRYYGVAWTPDGRILYGSDAGGQRNIWVMNADGSEPRRLTDDSFVDESPVATPDGRYIVYRSEREGFGNIWRIDAGGGNPRQLTQRGSANNPSVTPDSRSIMYDAAAVTGARLWKVSIDGGDPEELTTTTSHDPVVSPDGRLIAFWDHTATTASTTLSVVPIGGGAPLLDFHVSAERWRWERDGRALIYVDSAPGYSNFMRLPLNTGKPTATSAFTANRIPAFDLSRDGKRILFVGAAQQSDVVMIRGFR